MSSLISSIAGEVQHAGAAIETMLSVALVLDDQPRTGGEIVRATGRPRSSVYRHLEALADAGLAEKRADGYLRRTVTAVTPATAVPPAGSADESESSAPDRPITYKEPTRSASTSRPRQRERAQQAQLELDHEGDPLDLDEAEVERRIRELPAGVNPLTAAPRCSCDRPMTAVDEDGDRACGRCGRLLEDR